MARAYNIFNHNLSHAGAMLTMRGRVGFVLLSSKLGVAMPVICQKMFLPLGENSNFSSNNARTTSGNDSDSEIADV